MLLSSLLLVIRAFTMTMIHCYLQFDDGTRVTVVMWNNDVNASYHEVSIPLVSPFTTNVSHKFVLYDGVFDMVLFINPRLLSLFEVLQDRGALGVFIIDRRRTPGIPKVYLMVPTTATTITIPYGLVGSKAISEEVRNRVATNDESGVNVTFFGWDNNVWAQFLDNSPGFVVWWASLAVFHLGIVLWGAYKLMMWIIFKKGFELSIIMCCLFLEVVGTSLRGVSLLTFFDHFLVDPRILTTIFYPFTYSASALMAFFWLDMTSDSMYQGKFLDKMKIPTFLSMGVLYCMEVFIIISQYLTELDLRLLVYGTYIVFGVVLAMIYFVAGYRVLATANRATRLVSVTIKIMLTGVCYVGLAVFGIFAVLPGYVDEVPSYMTLWYLIYFLPSCINLLQVSIFDVPRTNHKKVIVLKSTHEDQKFEL